MSFPEIPVYDTIIVYSNAEYWFSEELLQLSQWVSNSLDRFKHITNDRFINRANS